MISVAQHIIQRDLMVVTSDLPGMDFVTMSLVHGCYVSVAS